MMLGMNGVELVRALRTDSRTLTLPVMILSARATEEARIEGIQAGADDYLVKPFSARELLARVAGQLAQSEHARRVQALRAEAEAIKAHLEMVLESVSDSFVAIDRDWCITYLNSKAAEESGRPKEALIGKDLRQVFSGDPANPFLGMLGDAMRERKPVRMEYCHAPTSHWWQVRAFPSPEGLVIFSTDISEHQQAEAEHQARLAAEAANQAKSEFLANMSHELRSPMNTILGFTRLMSNNPALPANIRDDLDLVLKSGEHLYALVNQVLDLSKLEAGHATFNEADFDLHLLLDDLRSLFARVAANKGLQLVLVRGPKVPRYVRSDALKLRQVQINLLDNAIKFTRKGSISLAVDMLAEGPAEPAENALVRLAFTVTDSGPGIAPEEVKNLFGAFVQAEAGRRQPQGTGLGLAISRGFVRLLGGEMELKSEVGKGTVVRFEIPVRVVAETPAVSAVQVRRVLALAPGQPRYRVLVADHQAEARELIERNLAPLGFEVREVGNGLEAIAAWQHWRPHLIWMNLTMPMLDGLEATRRIRAGPLGRHVVIIAVATGADEAERSEALAAGCNDLLRKPFREADLFAALEKNLYVRFIYEEALPAPPPLDPRALATLPEAQRAALEDALVRLDVGAIEQTIEAIRTSDTGIAEALAARARDFSYEDILSALHGEAAGDSGSPAASESQY
jgi:PAS domain S-box-containing protein